MTDPILTFLNALSLILVRLPYPFIQLIGLVAVCCAGIIIIRIVRAL